VPVDSLGFRKVLEGVGKSQSFNMFIGSLHKIFNGNGDLQTHPSSMMSFVNFDLRRLTSAAQRTFTYELIEI
jgi:hypothetical protein